jgi:hypothetical protein
MEVFMRTTRRLLTVVAIVVLASGILLRMLPARSPEGNSPLLSGPPEFIILSLLAALALYLRQVNLNAADVHYKIRHGELWKAPPEDAFRPQKLKQLRQTSATILGVTPFMFVVILVVCGRIVYDTLCRYYAKPWIEPLYALDFLIVVWLWFIFLGLTIAHFVVRYKDHHLQEQIAAADELNKSKSVHDEMEAEAELRKLDRLKRKLTLQKEIKDLQESAETPRVVLR